MCGIAGLFDPSSAALPTLQKMLACLSHRGPDDQGVWRDDMSGVALGHRRLSIIDLSTAGHQPMISASGRYVLTYNGEIYNHADLRHELEAADSAPTWRGTSDTETLLAAMDIWGLEKTLKRCNGMFALALWDNKTRCLSLARDRMGEKPLYFGWVGGMFCFASELKALTAMPGWSPRLHTGAVIQFLRSGYTQGLESAVAGIFRLPPAQSLSLSVATLQQPLNTAQLQAQLQPYWSLVDAAQYGLAHPLNDVKTAQEQLRALLHDAVAIRRMADVPLGAFLSGGIDSSLITAIMQAQNTMPVRTFSIGFDEPRFDEAPFARAVARHLGTEHTELYVDAQAALDLVPNLAHTFDEPFADFSQLPTLLLCKLARQHVTVALTGDGGDEMFAGYQRYFSILKLWRVLQPMPPMLRGGMAVTCQVVARLLAPLPSGSNPSGNLAFRLSRLAERLAIPDIDTMRRTFIGGAGYSRLLRQASYTVAPASVLAGMDEPLRQLVLGDQMDYLPDDVLFKVDRASMAHSLETRVPMLDHRIVELSWQLPTAHLTTAGQGKQPLRHLLEMHVPRSLFERPKQGFVPPMDEWLRGALRDWAEVRLSEEALRDLPMVNAGEVRSIWRAHQDQRMNAAYILWNVLMLADWRAQFGVSA